jgi:hypothetical protein
LLLREEEEGAEAVRVRELSSVCIDCATAARGGRCILLLDPTVAAAAAASEADSETGC